MTKAALRKVYLNKRVALSEKEFLQISYQLCENFFSFFDLTLTSVVHVFIPLEKKREPNTWLIIERIRKEFPHIRLSLPRVNVEATEIENFYFESILQLTPNAWGILEPKDGIVTQPEDISMVLVPMLIFDVKGNRVGYGKGFYDNFLSQCTTRTKLVGLSLFEPVDEIEDVEEHDVALNFCITPQKSYTF